VAAAALRRATATALVLALDLAAVAALHLVGLAVAAA
jgi:hypothetical protein